jgi:hypothetical protein
LGDKQSGWRTSPFISRGKIDRINGKILDAASLTHAVFIFGIPAEYFTEKGSYATFLRQNLLKNYMKTLDKES